MLSKLKILWSLFSHGKELRDKKFWLRGQAYVIPVVAGLLVSCIQLVQTFGVTIPAFLDQEVVFWISGIIYMLVNSGITIAANKELGIGNAPESPTGALPQESRRDAESSVQSSLEGSYDHAKDIANVQVVSGDASTSRFDDETHKRAQEWLDKQTQPGGVFYSP